MHFFKWEQSGDTRTDKLEQRDACVGSEKNDFPLTIMEESIESKGRMEVVVEEREEGGTEGRIYNEDSLPGDLQKTVLS